MVSLMNLIKISRPVLWPVCPLIYVSSFIFYGVGLDLKIILLMLSLSFPACLGHFIINDIFDFESDRINPWKNKRGIKLEPQDFFIYSIIAFICGSLVLIAALNISLTHFIIVLIIGIIAFFYSAPPVRFKGIPFIDGLSNTILLLLVFLLGFVSHHSYLELPPKVIGLFLFTIPIYNLACFIDYKYDLKAGDKTFATHLGRNAPLYYSLFVLLCLLLFLDLNSLSFKLILIVAIEMNIFAFFLDEKYHKILLNLHCSLFFVLFFSMLFLR